MQRFKNILVIPATPSADDAALRRAIRLAGANAARITLMWPLPQSADGGLEADAGMIAGGVIAAVDQQLEEALAPARAAGLPVRTAVRIGRPFIEVIREVVRGGHDLVMKTARGSETALLFGSTALHLLRKCPCPVWIVNPAPTPTAGTRAGVLAAVDTDTDDEKAIRLNRTIMELATSMAVLEQADLHVVHAWCVPHEELIRLSPWLQASRLEAYVKDSGERQRARFAALIEAFQHGGAALVPHFVKGIPSEVIPALARKHNVEIVVMATLAQTNVPGLLIGNTAEEVINELACSVLAIKPEGFVSPVAA